MTTFKVIPPKKSHDPELTPDDPDHIKEDEGSPQPGTEEDLCSPDGSQSPEEAQDSDGPGSPGSPLCPVGDTQQKEEDEPEVTSQVASAAPSDCSYGEPPSDGPIISEDQRELLQRSSRRPGATDMDHCGSNTDEEEVEEEEDSFPPPPSPVFFHEDTEVTAASSLTSSPPPSPSSSGPTSALGEDHQSTSAGPDQPLVQMSAAPSRFAQAVALAVQRSRLQGHGKGLDPQASSGPRSALPSPHISIYQFGEYR